MSGTMLFFVGHCGAGGLLQPQLACFQKLYFPLLLLAVRETKKGACGVFGFAGK